MSRKESAVCMKSGMVVDVIVEKMHGHALSYLICIAPIYLRDRSHLIQYDEEKLRGITLDKKLSFKKYVQTLCKKASQKLHALARISIFMELEKLKPLMKTFVMSLFSYCSLIWIFHD